jgi:hypothetical protein
MAGSQSAEMLLGIAVAVGIFQYFDGPAVQVRIFSTKASLP